jgi:hypothetical protein
VLGGVAFEAVKTGSARRTTLPLDLNQRAVVLVEALVPPAVFPPAVDRLPCPEATAVDINDKVIAEAPEFDTPVYGSKMALKF